MIAFHRAFEMGHERRAFDGEVVVVFHDLVLSDWHPPSLRGALATKQSMLPMPYYGLLRGVYHRARIRATRWLAMTERVTYSARDRRHPARLPSSSPTALDAGRWCASVLLLWSQGSSPPHSPGSIRSPRRRPC